MGRLAGKDPISVAQHLELIEQRLESIAQSLAQTIVQNSLAVSRRLDSIEQNLAQPKRKMKYVWVVCLTGYPETILIGTYNKRINAIKALCRELIQSPDCINTELLNYPEDFREDMPPKHFEQLKSKDDIKRDLARDLTVTEARHLLRKIIDDYNNGYFQCADNTFGWDYIIKRVRVK